MRISYKEIMDLLGVGYPMAPCEIFPWSYYDIDKQVTCTAEVRVGFDGEEVEAEIQLLHDVPVNGRTFEQIILLKATPRDDKWQVNFLMIKGEDKKGEVYDWETKSCRFFAACVQDIVRESIPDFDALLAQEFHSNEKTGGGGSGGRKSPKMKAGQVLGMNKRGGM